jgi:hypothetical protein
LLQRVCPEHGEILVPVWHGPPDYDVWRGSPAIDDAEVVTACCSNGGSEPGDAARVDDLPECPTACGPCARHESETCCVLLEVTSRCDLGCPVCFAGSGADGAADPGLDEIDAWFDNLRSAAPDCCVQLSGGEPAVRDDLAQIVAAGRRKGIRFLQLNTNGLRLAREPGLAAALAEAGLDVVFLQFDGASEEPYRTLRGRALLDVKVAAVQACVAAGLGVVLVPTVVDGVNLDQLGGILRFALEHAPGVRGVHLQPLALLGRYPGSEWAMPDGRVTLPDAMRALAEQSDGRVDLADLTPGDCEHPLCTFSREYLVEPNGRLTPLARPPSGCCPGGDDRSMTAGEKAARVAGRWAPSKAATCCGDATAASTAEAALDQALRDLQRRTFTISGMAFMDSWTIDLERLRRCYVHVLSGGGDLVPFCAYNLTGTDGRTLPRGRGAEMRREETHRAG